MFFKSAVGLSLLATPVVSEQDLGGGVWCAESNKNNKLVRGVATNTEKWPENSAAVSFRGRYSEFEIYVEDKPGTLEQCQVFKSHVGLNDGMWIIEEPSREVLEKTKATLRAAGLPIYYEGELSFIVGGK